MKFKHWNHAEADLELVDYVLMKLDGHDYDKGSVETALSQANNVSEAFAELLKCLVDKKILSKEDIEGIL